MAGGPYALGILLLAAALSGCLGGKDAPTGVDAGDQEILPAVPKEVEMYVVATDMSANMDANWKIRPARIEAGVGNVVNLTFKNAPGNFRDHNFVLEGLDVEFTGVKPGEARTALVTVEAAGVYQYYCNVIGHRELGMEGSLVVV